MHRRPVLTLTLLLVLAGTAVAEERRPTFSTETPVGAPPARLERRTGAWDTYRPSLPMGPTRSAWTSLVVSPTPFALTAGEALTPCRGRVALNWTRISDERFMDDLAGRRWDSDGEVQVIGLEVVGRRMPFRLGGRQLAAHLSASFHAYSVEHGVWERLRNLVEEDLLGATPTVVANHDIGGRHLQIGGDDLLESTPMMKVRLGAKVQMPCTTVFRHPLRTALSLGLTLPAFGGKNQSGNRDLQPDLTLAYRYTLARAWGITGALTVSWPGTSERFAALGVRTSDVLLGGNLNLEWWFHRCWAVALGFQYQTSYLEGTGLAMDEDSTYVNLGFLWRPHPRHALHIVFSENPQGKIAFGSTRNFSDTQRDADFTMLLGWRFSL
jgi:hypothetical protein